MSPTADLNVREYRRLPPPDAFLRSLPATPSQANRVHAARGAIQRILRGEDRRLLAIVGPCSIHDVPTAREYAGRMAALARAIGDRVFLTMRVYFEKPRTATGWPGLILDPGLDGSGEVARGLRLARQFLREVLDLGLPTAMEFLDPISPQYISDLVCWAAVGARTSESQTHRQLASGLSMPVGCKNGTSGNIQGAVNAIRSARRPQTFFGIGPDGRAAAVHTRGNPNCHLVLRGGAGGPNYSSPDVASALAALEAAEVPRAIVVDCSHDNSGRDPLRQPEVARRVVAQICAGNRAIVGLMMESNLHAGSQRLDAAGGHLRAGVSITDPCLDWAATERCLMETHAALAGRGVNSPPWCEEAPVSLPSPSLV